MHAKDDVNFNQLQLNTFLLFVLLVTGVHGRITKFPGDSYVSKGKTNVFTCCSDIQKTIFWKHRNVGSLSTNDIYDLNGLVNGYLTSRRFKATLINSAGCQSLIIKDVDLEDGGTYSCTDGAGLGQCKGWELIVLDSFDCQETNRKTEYMGENNFGLPQDVISTECVSKYFGNVPPTQICEWSSGIELHDTYHRVTETKNTTTLTIQMPARKEFNGDQLTCYVKIEGNSNDRQIQTEWKSPRLIINYALFRQKGVGLLQCSIENLSLDCHPLCNYKSKRLNNGSTYCEIDYQIRTHKKILVLLQDNAGLPGTSNIHGSTLTAIETPSSVTATVSLTSVIMGMIGIIVGIGVSFLICRCWKRSYFFSSPFFNTHIFGGSVNPGTTFSGCQNSCTMNSRCEPCQVIDYAKTSPVGQQCFLLSPTSGKNTTTTYATEERDSQLVFGVDGDVK